LGGGAGGECAGAVVEGRLVLAFNFVRRLRRAPSQNWRAASMATRAFSTSAAALATAVVSVL